MYIFPIREDARSAGANFSATKARYSSDLLKALSFEKYSGSSFCMLSLIQDDLPHKFQQTYDAPEKSRNAIAFQESYKIPSSTFSFLN